MMDRQIVFVLSTNYAGSHFLTLQLGSHSRCASVGELRRFDSKGKRRFKICYRCGKDDQCPVFSGVRNLPAQAMFGKLFENLHDYAPEVHTIIDNSKNTRWASRFLDLSGYKKRYIHLVRDPRALIRRWTLVYENPQAKQRMKRMMARRCWRHAWDILRGDEANVYLWKWLHHNKLITDFIRDNDLDASLITYHDLVCHADETLGRLMDWLGLDYEPAQKQYWSFVHHGSVKPGYMFPENEGRTLYDQRWKEFLDEKTQQAALTHAGINAYVRELGLNFDPDKGLTRNDLSGGVVPIRTYF